MGTIANLREEINMLRTTVAELIVENKQLKAELERAREMAITQACPAGKNDGPDNKCSNRDKPHTCSQCIEKYIDTGE